MGKAHIMLASSENFNLANETIHPHEPLTETLFKLYTRSAFVFTGPFIPIGIFFNTLILIIFIRTGTGTTPSTRVYYVAMAYGTLGTIFIKDMWFYYLAVGVPSVFPGWDPLGPLNPHSRASSLILCKIIVFLWFTHEMFSNLIFTVFAIERVTAIYSPFKALYFFTKKKAHHIAECIFIVSIVISAIPLKICEWVAIKDIMPTNQICSFVTSNAIWTILGAILFFFNYILPAILSAACSILITFKIVPR